MTTNTGSEFGWHWQLLTDGYPVRQCPLILIELGGLHAHLILVYLRLLVALQSTQPAIFVLLRGIGVSGLAGLSSCVTHWERRGAHIVQSVDLPQFNMAV